MDKEMKLNLVKYFTFAYLIIFTTISIVNRNYEFIYYSFIISILVLVAVFYHKKINLPFSILAGLSLIAAMHLLGGNVSINGTRLYDFWFIHGILKFDNIMHFVAIFVATIVAYDLLSPHLSKKLNGNRFMLSLILVLIALGIGALNEISELIAVAALDAADGVGTYMNNAIDHVFNLLGAGAACAFLIWKDKR